MVHNTASIFIVAINKKACSICFPCLIIQSQRQMKNAFCTRINTSDYGCFCARLSPVETQPGKMGRSMEAHNPDFYLFQSCLFSSNDAFILKNLKAGQGSQKRHDNLQAFAIKAVLPEKLRTHSPTSATESHLSLQIPHQRHLKTLSVVGRCSIVLLISAPKEFLFRMEEGTLPLGEGASASPKG